MSSHQTYREVNPRLTTTSSDQGTSSMLPPQEQVTSYQASASALQGRQTASLFHELELSQRCVQAQSVQIEILKGQVQASQAQVTRLHSQLLMANRVSSENFQASEHHKSQSYQLSFELAASEERNLGQLKEIMMLKEQLHTTREIPRASSEASQPILSLEQTQSAAKQVATHQPSSPPSNNQWAKLSQWAEKKLPNVSVNTANNVKSAIEGGLSQLKNPLESQAPNSKQKTDPNMRSEANVPDVEARRRTSKSRLNPKSVSFTPSPSSSNASSREEVKQPLFVKPSKRPIPIINPSDVKPSDGTRIKSPKMSKDESISQMPPVTPTKILGTTVIDFAKDLSIFARSPPGPPTSQAAIGDQNSDPKKSIASKQLMLQSEDPTTADFRRWMDQQLTTPVGAPACSKVPMRNPSKLIDFSNETSPAQAADNPHAKVDGSSLESQKTFLGEHKSFTDELQKAQKGTKARQEDASSIHKVSTGSPMNDEKVRPPSPPLASPDEESTDHKEPMPASEVHHVASYSTIVQPSDRSATSTGANIPWVVTSDNVGFLSTYTNKVSSFSSKWNGNSRATSRPASRASVVLPSATEKNVDPWLTKPFELPSELPPAELHERDSTPDFNDFGTLSDHEPGAKSPASPTECNTDILDHLVKRSDDRSVNGTREIGSLLDDEVYRLVVKPNAWSLDKAMERPENVFYASGIYGSDFCGNRYYLVRWTKDESEKRNTRGWVLSEVPRLSDDIEKKNGMIMRALKSVSPWAHEERLGWKIV